MAHQACLQADVAVAHFAFYFGFGDERGNGVHHHHVHPAASDQCVADFQSLFACVGLGDEQIFHVYAELARVNRIEGVFCVNKGAHAACFLALGDGFQTQRGFAR